VGFDIHHRGRRETQRNRGSSGGDGWLLILAGEAESSETRPGFVEASQGVLLARWRLAAGTAPGGLEDFTITAHVSAARQQPE
jgi:hypothetical protein